MYMWGVIYVFEGVIYLFGGVVLTSLHIYIWRCDIWHRLRVWSTPLLCSTLPTVGALTTTVCTSVLQSDTISTIGTLKCGKMWYRECGTGSSGVLYRCVAPSTPLWGRPSHSTGKSLLVVARSVPKCPTKYHTSNQYFSRGWTYLDVLNRKAFVDQMCLELVVSRLWKLFNNWSNWCFQIFTSPNVQPLPHPPINVILSLSLVTFFPFLWTLTASRLRSASILSLHHKSIIPCSYRRSSYFKLNAVQLQLKITFTPKTFTKSLSL